MSDTIRALAHVQQKIEELRQEQVAFVAASRADTFDEYKKICGVIRGDRKSTRLNSSHT